MDTGRVLHPFLRDRPVLRPSPCPLRKPNWRSAFASWRRGTSTVAANGSGIILCLADAGRV
eukprot:1062923-Lingulodinium_polyedra.AAC.1